MYGLVCLFTCRVVNEPLESIALDLGFGGNTLAEGGIPCLVFSVVYVLQCVDVLMSLFILCWL